MPGEIRAMATLTSKGQVTIPQAIRERLGMTTGDRLRWEVSAAGVVTVAKVEVPDPRHLRALQSTLAEWSSEADEEAFRDF